MDASEFHREQYLTLRKEIEDIRDRMHKIVVFGLVVVPSAHFVADKYEVDSIVYSLPMLVIVIALLYLADNNALMRCGRFIRLHIEPQASPTQGWEDWLETKAPWDTRTVDRYLAFAFFGLFLVYFVGAISTAVEFAYRLHGALAASGILGFYIAVGVWFSIFLTKNIRFRTTSTEDGFGRGYSDNNPKSQ